MVDTKIAIMNQDVHHLNKLVKHRNAVIKDNERIIEKEKRNEMSALDKIREDHCQMRCAKNDAKEVERQKVSRTYMANLSTAAESPDCPPYVHHIINVLKNILGKFF